MPHSRVRRLVVPALVGLALGATGCSSGAVTDPAGVPGVAAQVGDVRIDQSTVDRTARAICADLEPQFVERGAPVAMAQVKQYALSLLAARAQAEQVAAEYDVEPGPQVAEDEAGWEERAERVPSDLVDDFVTAMSTETLLTSLLTQAGEASLREEGVRRPTEDQVVERGGELFAQWAEQAEITIDPRYAVVAVDGALQPANTGLSVPVSAAAIQAWAETTDPQQSDPDRVAALPDTQRCG